MDDPEPAEDQHEQVLRAAAACPVQAIRVDRIASRDAAEAAETPAFAGLYQRNGRRGVLSPRPSGPSAAVAAS